jgi:hypothetical protein
MSDASAAVNVKLIIMDTLVRAGQGRTVSAHHLMKRTGLDFPSLRTACEEANEEGFLIIPTATGWQYRSRCHVTAAPLRR